MKYQMLHDKCKMLSQMGYRIRLWQDGNLWRWQWNNGITGYTDADSKALALVFALETI